MIGIVETCIIKQYMTTIETLKIISKIKENDKLSTKNNILIEGRYSNMQFISRWVNGESRIKNIIKLSNFFDRVFELFTDITVRLNDNNCIQHNDGNLQRLLFRLYNNIMKSKEGILNLKVTYESDNMITAKIDSLYERICDRLVGIENKYNVVNIENRSL